MVLLHVSPFFPWKTIETKAGFRALAMDGVVGARGGSTRM